MVSGAEAGGQEGARKGLSNAGVGIDQKRKREQISAWKERNIKQGTL